jgi:LEA14-like dessication related protein
MNGRRKTIPGGLLAVMWLAACSTSGQLVESPTIELTSVEVSSIGFNGQTFLLSFGVSNPNPFPLPVRSVRYNVQLADQRFASGETASNFSIPARGKGEFAISVDLDVLRSAHQLTSVLHSGVREPVVYELSGTLAVDLPLVKPLPFSSSGVISIAAN